MQVTLNPIDQVTNQPISPDGRKIAPLSPYFPSSWTDNNIHVVTASTATQTSPFLPQLWPKPSPVIIAPTCGGMARLSAPDWHRKYRNCIPTKGVNQSHYDAINFVDMNNAITSTWYKRLCNELIVIQLSLSVIKWVSVIIHLWGRKIRPYWCYFLSVQRDGLICLLIN